MPKISGVSISYCGLVCEFCVAFTSGKCRGCDAHADVCEFARCAIERGVSCCLGCGDFPCKLHSEGFDWETDEFGKLRWRVYSEIFLRVFSGQSG